MKNILFTLIFICCAQYSSHASNNQLVKNTNAKDDNELLDFYSQYSSFTDPGEYAYLYANLPDSLLELCKLIRSQYIHPYGELNKYRELIPKERWNEAFKYPTVQSILEGLVSYDSSGLTMFVVSIVRNPGSIKLRDRLLISKLFFVLQNPTFFSAGFAA